jgi:hypothetical protein
VMIGWPTRDPREQVEVRRRPGGLGDRGHRTAGVLSCTGSATSERQQRRPQASSAGRRSSRCWRSRPTDTGSACRSDSPLRSGEKQDRASWTSKEAIRRQPGRHYGRRPRRRRPARRACDRRTGSPLPDRAPAPIQARRHQSRSHPRRRSGGRSPPGAGRSTSNAR